MISHPVISFSMMHMLLCALTGAWATCPAKFDEHFSTFTGCRPTTASIEVEAVSSSVYDVESCAAICLRYAADNVLAVQTPTSVGMPMVHAQRSLLAPRCSWVVHSSNFCLTSIDRFFFYIFLLKFILVMSLHTRRPHTKRLANACSYESCAGFGFRQSRNKCTLKSISPAAEAKNVNLVCLLSSNLTGKFKYFCHRFLSVPLAPLTYAPTEARFCLLCLYSTLPPDH